MKLSSAQIRRKYLDFFASKGHAIIESSPVVPENDPSTLFNSAGMQPLVPYLLGEKHPMGKRLADVQKCVRTGDIDDVGDNRHLTFFEMLGNWSLGDYFKKESITWSYEFLTDPKWLGISPDKLAVTVFEGNADAPRDEESAAIWKSLGVSVDRIAYLPAEDNWWAAGATGPCGPDTEIFYWVGEGAPQGNVGTHPKQWMEIWNNVFMQFDRKADGQLVPLAAPCVDTGMGVERVTAVLGGFKEVWQTDIFVPALARIREIVGERYLEKSARIIADHVRSAVHMVADGVTPKNVQQGYVLRRLIRRAVREFLRMGAEGTQLGKVAQVFVEQFRDVYASVKLNEVKIFEEIAKEEAKFQKTLQTGVRTLENFFEEIEKAKTSIQHISEGIVAQAADGKYAVLVGNVVNTYLIKEPFGALLSGNLSKEELIREASKLRDSFVLSGHWVFHLFDTFGFPMELTAEMASERGLKADLVDAKRRFAEHQEKSRTASAGTNKGGLAEQSDITTNLHSATHLMLAGLRQVLGTHVHQAGSNITSERLRFDFTHPEKVTPEQLAAVEKYVNDAIQADAQMTLTEMKKDDAKASGTEGSFWEKYPNVVKVYEFKDASGKVWSREMCGGPHATSAGKLGSFKIQKEEASSSGVRRIKATIQ